MKSWLLGVAVALALLPGVSSAQGGPDKQKKPSAVEILKKVQKLMREIEKDLARAGVKPDERKMTKVRREIEKLMRSNKDQQEVKKKLEELMKQAGMSGGKAAQEIEKLLKARQNQQQVQAAIKKLMEQAKQAARTSKKIDELFKQSMDKQGQALQQMEQVIKHARREMQRRQQQHEEEQKKKQAKKKKEEQQKKEPPRKPYDPKQKPPKDDRKPKDGKTDRWGEMQGKKFDAVGSGGKRKVPEKYRHLIDWYRRSIAGDKDR